MDAARLLRRLRDAGFRVKTEGEEVLVAPASRLTPSMRRRIRTVRGGLRERVRDGASKEPVRCVDCRTVLPLSGVRCPTCRDATEDPTCASCGVETNGPDLAICDLCVLEAAGAVRSDDVPEPEEA